MLFCLLQSISYHNRTAGKSTYLRLARFQQLIDFFHHLERVGDVHHIRFAARPATVWIQTDGAAFAHEAPTNNVRLFAVATGRKPLWMSRGGACSPNLIQVRQKRKYRLIFATLVHERFAA